MNPWRHPGHGEENHHAKLRDVEAREIKAARASGASLVDLSRAYGVSVSAVSRIARDLRRHHPDDVEP
jgi:Mor family transcriptional regulator